MTNAEIVRAVVTALEQGDVLVVLAHMVREIIWTVRAPDAAIVTWLGVYAGRRGIADLVGALAAVRFVSARVTSLAADGDTVVTTTRLVFDDPAGRRVTSDEVQVWHLTEGKITRVDVDVSPPVPVDASP
jgi:ketosteroid isomerase-like protein